VPSQPLLTDAEFVLTIGFFRVSANLKTVTDKIDELLGLYFRLKGVQVLGTKTRPRLMFDT
jgi:hypothetical protein